jgi:hypothetical protein
MIGGECVYMDGRLQTREYNLGRLHHIVEWLPNISESHRCFEGLQLFMVDKL